VEKEDGSIFSRLLSCSSLREDAVQERLVWLLTIAAGIILLVAALWRQSDDRAGSGTSDDAVADRRIADSRTALDSLSHLPEPIWVEVLNGCGAPQVAARLTKKARALGIDVIDEGNAESFSFLQSMVIDRRGDWDLARRVAAALGIPHCIQQIRDDPSRLAAVSIIIGGDYERLKLLDQPPIDGE
jgi:hypothetical protein